MNSDIERIAQAACQRLFAVSAHFTWLAGAGLAGTVLLLWLAPRAGAAGWLLAAALPAGLTALYYGFRVRLDAALFSILDPPGPVAEADFAAGIDLFRAQLAGRTPLDNSPGGPLAPRFAGALRLWRRSATALGLQLVLLAGAGGAACAVTLAAG